MSTTIPLVIVCGPTATGKTGLGIDIAKRLNGEIVSADSRQIYKDMSIGTGKDLPPNAKLQLDGKKCDIGYHVVGGVKVWLYDIINPDQQFSAGEYASIAHRTINNVHARGKLPIVVGGSGLYISSVIDGFDTVGSPPDWDLRKKLELFSVSMLQKKLSHINPDRLAQMNNSDRNNPRRLIRAIEIANSKIHRLKHAEQKINSYKAVFIGLTCDKDTLYERIDLRVEKRLKEGIVKEIRSLLASGCLWTDPGLNTLGYRQWRPYFEKKSSIQAVVEAWKKDEHSYARRQMTWFKKDKRIYWFDIRCLNKQEVYTRLQHNDIS